MTSLGTDPDPDADADADADPALEESDVCGLLAQSAFGHFTCPIRGSVGSSFVYRLMIFP